jgi:hypothetical protein
MCVCVCVCEGRKKRLTDLIGRDSGLDSRTSQIEHFSRELKVRYDKFP